MAALNITANYVKPFALHVHKACFFLYFHIDKRDIRKHVIWNLWISNKLIKHSGFVRLSGNIFLIIPRSPVSGPAAVFRRLGRYRSKRFLHFIRRESLVWLYAAPPKSNNVAIAKETCSRVGRVRLSALSLNSSGEEVVGPVYLPPRRRFIYYCRVNVCEFSVWICWKFGGMNRYIYTFSIFIYNFSVTMYKLNVKDSTLLWTLPYYL